MANQNNSFFNKASSIYGLIKDTASKETSGSTSTKKASSSTPTTGYKYHNSAAKQIINPSNAGWRDTSTYISNIQKNLNFICQSIANSEKDIWYGVAATSVKNNLMSLAESISGFDNNLTYLDNAVKQKENVESALDLFAADDAYLRNLKVQRNSGAEIPVGEINRATTRRNDSLEALNNASTSLSEILNSIKSVSFNSVTSNNTETEIYKINPTEVSSEVVSVLEDVNSSLETLKSRLNNSIYNNDVLTSSVGILSRKVFIGNARDRIVRNIESFQTRLRRIIDRINEHLENIIGYENNETVEIKNGEGTLTPQTVTVETEVNESYTVKSGDTLIGIASKYDGVTWQSIYEANKNNPDAMPNGDYKQLVIGSSIVIPGLTKTITKTTTNTTNNVVDTIASEKLPEIEMFHTNEIIDFNKLNQSNWNAEVSNMVAGEYNAPMTVNSDGYMVDKTGKIGKYDNGMIKVSSPIGWRFSPITGKWQYHRGTDYYGVGTGDFETPIKAIGPGIVIAADNSDAYNDGYGNYVKVLHETVDEDGNYGYVISKYEHFEDTLVKPGDVIDEDTIIGTMGTTGASNGIHLHLEVSKVPQISEEDLRGKSPEEIVKYTQTKKIDDETIADAHHYGIDNLVDTEEYYESNGIKLERG